MKSQKKKEIRKVISKKSVEKMELLVNNLINLGMELIMMELLILISQSYQFHQFSDLKVIIFSKKD